MLKELTAADVLKEFVEDVEAAYRPAGELREEWPDLYVTYLHAKAVLAREEKGNA